MRKSLAIFALVSLFPLVVFAEENVITLGKALNLASKNNIALKREALAIGSSERASKHSWNSLLPSITVSAIDDIALPDIKGDSTGTGVHHNVGLEGKVELTISSGFLASIDKAKLDYEASRITYEEALSEILSQVKEQYFSLLLEKENLEFLKENLENARSQAEQNEIRFKKGTLSEMEYLSSKAAYGKLKPEYTAQLHQFKNNHLVFLRFLGLENVSSGKDAERFSLNGTLEEYVEKYAAFFDNNRKADLTRNMDAGNVPSIISLKKQLIAAQKQVSVERHNAYGPSLNLSYTVNPVLAGMDEGRIKQSAYIGLSVPLDNYFSFSKGATEISNAEDRIKELEFSIQEKSLNMTTDFSSIVEVLTQKEESVEAFKDLVAVSEKNYDAIQYAYAKGMTDHLSLKTAANEKLEAKLNLQNEYLEILKLYVSLEKFSGENIPLEN